MPISRSQPEHPNYGAVKAPALAIYAVTDSVTQLEPWQRGDREHAAAWQDVIRGLDRVDRSLARSVSAGGRTRHGTRDSRGAPLDLREQSRRSARGGTPLPRRHSSGGSQSMNRARSSGRRNRRTSRRRADSRCRVARRGRSTQSRTPPRHDAATARQRAPHAAEVAQHAQRRGRSHERRRVADALEPDHRIGRRELWMPCTDRGPRRPLQAREVERPRADVVPQHELHGVRAESAGPVVEEQGPARSGLAHFDSRAPFDLAGRADPRNASGRTSFSAVSVSETRATFVYGESELLRLGEDRRVGDATRRALRVHDPDRAVVRDGRVGAIDSRHVGRAAHVHEHDVAILRGAGA